MKRPRFTEEQIIAILREQEASMPVMDLCRKHGLSSPTFYKWKARYGRLVADRGAGRLAADRSLTAEFAHQPPHSAAGDIDPLASFAARPRARRRRRSSR